jgi:hypothetical protein
MELVERDQQLQKLTDAWRQVKAGKGRTALISGAAGYEILNQVELNQVLVSFGDPERTQHKLSY